jgi:hypothetical protein
MRRRIHTLIQVRQPPNLNFGLNPRLLLPHEDVGTYTPTHPYTNTHTHTHTHVYACMHVCMYIRMYIRMFVCVCVCVCVRVLHAQVPTAICRAWILRRCMVFSLFFFHSPRPQRRYGGNGFRGG